MAGKKATKTAKGPFSKLQGKMIDLPPTKENRGPVDTPNSNGSWDAKSSLARNFTPAPQGGSRKSF